MKEATIPLTERQLCWILFSSFFALLTYWSLSIYLQDPRYPGVVYLALLVDFLYGITALCLDGRHDMNPAHWVGYCLKLKEGKQ